MTSTTPLATATKKRKNRAKKDPNAPKRGLSGYVHFCADQRGAIKAALPEGHGFGDVGKALGKAWKDLTDDAKAPYLALALTDRARYVAEAAAYTPPPRDPDDEEADGAKKKKKAKKDRDPNKPKRGLSGFMFLSAARRAPLRASVGLAAKVTEVASLLGAEWRGMDEAAKAPYEAQALVDKARYLKAMATYAP